MNKEQASFEILKSLTTGADVRNMSDNDIEKYAKVAIRLAEELHQQLKED